MPEEQAELVRYWAGKLARIYAQMPPRLLYKAVWSMNEETYDLLLKLPLCGAPIVRVPGVQVTIFGRPIEITDTFEVQLRAEDTWIE